MVNCVVIGFVDGRFRVLKTCQIFENISVEFEWLRRDVLSCLGERSGIQVLDEDGFVADLIVDQLVDGAASKKKPVSAGPHSFFCAMGDVSGGIV